MTKMGTLFTELADCNTPSGVLDVQCGPVRVPRQQAKFWVWLVVGDRGPLYDRGDTRCYCLSTWMNYLYRKSSASAKKNLLTTALQCLTKLVRHNKAL